MDFSKVKSITIPEGVVTKIVAGAVTIWEKVKEVVTLNNLLPKATTTDRKTIYGGDYNGDGTPDGYMTDRRLSSSGGGADVAAGGMCCSGFIPVQLGDVLCIENTTPKVGTASYVMTYDSSNNLVAYEALAQDGTWVNETYAPWQSYNTESGVLRIQLTSEWFGTGFDAIRFSAGTISAATIVTKYTNHVLIATEADGVTIYNGGLGYKDGYRVRSGGAEIEQSGGRITGFIPVVAGDVVRMTGWDWSIASVANAVNFFGETFNNLGQFTTQPASYGICLENVITISNRNGFYWFTVPNDADIRYMRVTGYDGRSSFPAEMVIAINEEITI